MTTIPTIQNLYNNILASLEVKFSITINQDGHAFLETLAAVIAGELYMNYLAVGDTQKNVWYDTADSEANGGTLERYGRSILKRNPDPADQGVYDATVTGTTSAVIPGNSVFKADDTATSPGTLFQIQGGDFTLSGSTDTISVIALVGGLDSQLVVSDTLTATAPIANVNSIITISAITTDPVNAEGKEEYRTKIGEKVQLIPGSWSAADYRLLGLNVTGVFQTYAYANSGTSAVVDVFLQGNTPVASPGPSVSVTVISDYSSAFNAVEPLSVWAININSCPINDVDVTINMGSFPAFSVSQKADILAALSDFVNNVHPFIAAADVVADRNDIITQPGLGGIATSAVPGYGFSTLTFTVAGSPVTSWQADNGNIAFLNSVTYV